MKTCILLTAFAILASKVKPLAKRKWPKAGVTKLWMFMCTLPIFVNYCLVLCRIRCSIAKQGIVGVPKKPSCCSWLGRVELILVVVKVILRRRIFFQIAPVTKGPDVIMKGEFRIVNQDDWEKEAEESLVAKRYLLFRGHLELLQTMIQSRESDHCQQDAEDDLCACHCGSIEADCRKVVWSMSESLPALQMIPFGDCLMKPLLWEVALWRLLAAILLSGGGIPTTLLDCLIGALWRWWLWVHYL